MTEVKQKKLSEIKGGGGISFGAGLLIAAGVVFVIGIVDGYLRPLKCNK